MTRALRCAGGALAVCALAACARPEEGPPLPARHQRYGVFRDLVLIARREAKGGPYFLDRFETSRRDLLEWLAETGTPPPPGWAESRSAGADDPASLRPATCVDLDTARRYARWRFCRLPTFAEWEHAATAGGAYRFPWGDPIRAEWANTSELGLGQPTAIGTFESGRSPDGPYDLIGNAAEWTETLSPAAASDLLAAPRLPAITVWLGLCAPAPLFAQVAAAPRVPARVVAGGAYLDLGDRETRALSRPAASALSCRPYEWSDTIGVRLAADPAGLLAALLCEPELPDAAAQRVLREFLEQPGHRAVLAPALLAATAAVAEPGPLLALLHESLRP